MSHNFIVLEPDLILGSLTGIDWVQRGLAGQSMVVSYFSGQAEHKITYASDALAIDAVNDWLATANAAPEPVGGLVIGDPVRVSHHNHARGALGTEFDGTLVGFPSVEFPFWVILTATVTMYVDNVTVSKLV